MKKKDLANDGEKSLGKYNTDRETDYLLSTEANRKRLKKSIENIEKGKTRKFNLDEI